VARFKQLTFFQDVADKKKRRNSQVSLVRSTRGVHGEEGYKLSGWLLDGAAPPLYSRYKNSELLKLRNELRLLWPRPVDFDAPINLNAVDDVAALSDVERKYVEHGGE